MPEQGPKDHFFFGKIVKSFGYKGELILAPDVDDPEKYTSLESVFVEINKQAIPFFIDRIEYRANGTLLLKFADIDSPQDAAILMKARTFLPINMLKQLSDEQFYYHDIIGYKVVEQLKGPLGTIVDVVENAEQDLLVVKQGNSEILIPLVDEFIANIDKEGEILNMSLPEGLIDLYL